MDTKLQRSPQEIIREEGELSDDGELDEADIIVDDAYPSQVQGKDFGHMSKRQNDERHTKPTAFHNKSTYTSRQGPLAEKFDRPYRRNIVPNTGGMAGGEGRNRNHSRPPSLLDIEVQVPDWVRESQRIPGDRDPIPRRTGARTGLSPPGTRRYTRAPAKETHPMRGHQRTRRRILILAILNL